MWRRPSLHASLFDEDGAYFSTKLITTGIVYNTAAAVGALLVFMSAFNDLNVSALLWSSRNETIGVILFSLDESGLSP